MNELKRVDRYSEYRDNSDWMMPYKWATISDRLQGARVLEVGCSRGDMSVLLERHSAVQHLAIVDGSETCIRQVRDRMTRTDVDYHVSLWENWSTGTKFNDIIFSCGLEHVADPVAILRRMATWLHPSGQIHIIVPNAGSIHRRVGVTMGILETTNSFSDADRGIGHRRVYDYPQLTKNVRDAGLIDVECVGLLLKPVSNKQILQFTQEHHAALYQMGQRIPIDMCSQLYLRARKGESECDCV